MTREEHEKIVDAVIDAHKDNEMGGKYAKAFNCGVQSAFNRVCKALEDIKKQQQPCEDCISRAAALDTLKTSFLGMSFERYKKAKRMFEQLPSVTPQQTRWIPISERLPEEDGQYLITVKYKPEADYENIYAEHGEWVDGRWDMFCFGHCGEVEEIVAWMPLPEPYKGGGEDEDRKTL